MTRVMVWVVVNVERLSSAPARNTLFVTVTADDVCADAVPLDSIPAIQATPMNRASTPVRFVVVTVTPSNSSRRIDKLARL
jgi:hypothetical protein